MWCSSTSSATRGQMFDRKASSSTTPHLAFRLRVLKMLACPWWGWPTAFGWHVTESPSEDKSNFIGSNKELHHYYPHKHCKVSMKKTRSQSSITLELTLDHTELDHTRSQSSIDVSRWTWAFIPDFMVKHLGKHLGHAISWWLQPWILCSNIFSGVICWMLHNWKI